MWRAFGVQRWLCVWLLGVVTSLLTASESRAADYYNAFTYAGGQTYRINYWEYVTVNGIPTWKYIGSKQYTDQGPVPG